MPKLLSTLTAIEYPFERLEEFAENGESLEVSVPGIDRARPRFGAQVWQRFADFLPFRNPDPAASLGEGNTPLLPAGSALAGFTGLPRLWLKNETQNPTASFKDRGSLTCVFLARQLGENVTATISTGNMGHSIAAYAARSGLRTMVFVPEFAPREKVLSIALHGASVLRVRAPDYSAMKQTILGLARELSLRIVSGNGPIRVEGYKLTAFELYEQFEGALPDFIAVPTSACGHIRGLFKGFRELRQAGLINKVPRFIIVQAANNSPIVTAIKRGLDHIVPFSNFHTVAEAITSGNPAGGDELIHKAREYNWLAEEVTESEILDSQRRLAQAGFFVEPAAATSLAAVRKLRESGAIHPDQSVLLMLTGSGLKDIEVLKNQQTAIIETSMHEIRDATRRELKRQRSRE